MISPSQTFVRLSPEGKLLPQEEMLEISRQKKNMLIGVPKDTSFQENRVALVPEAVNLLVNNGHEVIVETNAGKASHFEDREYSDAGARIVYSPQEVYVADLILKVAPPSKEEIEMMHEKQVLFSALHATIHDKEYFKAMIDKRLTTIAFENLKDDCNTYPIVRSMSEIAGNTAILIAAEYLSNVNNGKGLILGGISGVTPTEVVILGAGTVGEFAARSAMGLGAVVKVFDNSIHKLRNLQSRLGTRIFTSIIQPKVLQKALMRADVVIGALNAHGKRTPCVVSESMVSEMKAGSVIIDVSIDQGGCFETSRVTNHSDPIFKKHDIIHYCVPNIPSRVARTASYALSNVVAPILLNIGEEGGFEILIKKDPGVRNGIYLYNGILTNSFVGETYGIPYKDIDLLMAAF